MKVLKRGASGQQVRRWQQFLNGQGIWVGDDGQFGKKTEAGTMEFQSKHKLDPDGKVGDQTFGKAMMLGFGVVEDPDDNSRTGPNWPRSPEFKPLLGTRARQDAFGKYKFEAAPTDKNKERIVILDDWERKNIVKVEIPQLAMIARPRRTTVRCHGLVANQLVALWAAWEKAGLLDRVVTWNGSFVPRFIRGRPGQLSNHAFGSAFDVNAATNGLGRRPPLVGQNGSVRELVPLAHKHGFYWGGHFKKRPDGMHFEVAVIKK